MRSRFLKRGGRRPKNSAGANQIIMNCRHLDGSRKRPASGLFIVCATVAWLPFLCLFVPFRITVQSGDAWYMSCTSVLYLWAYWFNSPAVVILGPSWLVGAAFLQSMFLTLALQICIQNLSRLIESVSPLLMRIVAGCLERIAYLSRHLATADRRAAFLVASKHFYPKRLTTL